MIKTGYSNEILVYSYKRHLYLSVLKYNLNIKWGVEGQTKLRFEFN